MIPINNDVISMSRAGLLAWLEGRTIFAGGEWRLVQQGHVLTVNSMTGQPSLLALADYNLSQLRAWAVTAQPLPHEKNGRVPSSTDQDTAHSPAARHTFNLDPWSRLYCFSCPLDDCAGRSSVKCPIVQAKKSQAAPSCLTPSPLKGEGRGGGREGVRL